MDADALVLPPVQQGDLLRLLADLPDVVAIVDGYFLHKEIPPQHPNVLDLMAGEKIAN